MTIVLIGKGLVLGKNLVRWGSSIQNPNLGLSLLRKLPSHSCEGIAVIVFHQLQDGDHITWLHLELTNVLSLMDPNIGKHYRSSPFQTEGWWYCKKAKHPKTLRTLINCYPGFLIKSISRQGFMTWAHGCFLFEHSHKSECKMRVASNGAWHQAP